tara:strand:+ start:589 stop:1680 length:1092 start_codon:yes stop_codon:yes gene_type:complete
MNDKYKIIDTRLNEEFKQKTFSGFQKKDVIAALFKSIDQGKIEAACHWCTECIVSGYTMKIWDRLIVYACKIVHINNPKLPFFLYKKNMIIFNQLNRLECKNKDYLILRNSQMIRNLLCDLITTIITSEKKKRYDKLLKIKDSDMNISNKLQANIHILPSSILRFDDPEELKIIINEFYFHLKNQLSGYDKAVYWILWLLEWERKHKKNKENWTIPERKVNIKADKDKGDFIWIIWETIFVEMNNRDNNMMKNCIKVLYSLYTNNYTGSKRNTRIFLVYCAIGHLTNNLDYTKSIRLNHAVFIQTQANINKMYEIVKRSEKNNVVTKPVEKVKKKDEKKSEEKIELEKMNDRLSGFNELNNFI